MLVEDTKGDKNEAINAMNKVISKDKVVAVIGPMLSGEMMAAGPVANKSKIVALGTSTTAEVLQISAITFSVTLYQNPWQ